MLRFDDHRGVAPREIEISGEGARFVLRRTKTTGRSEKVEVWTVALSSGAFVEEQDWLQIGVGMLRELGAPERDYLPTSPGRGLEGERARELTYQEAAGWSRALLMRMATELGCTQPEAVPVSQHYTEHGCRSFLPTAAMAMGAEEEYLRPLGSWGAKVAQTYMKAARARMLQAQRRVAERVRVCLGPARCCRGGDTG